MTFASVRHQKGPSVSLAELRSYCIALAERSYGTVMEEAYLRMARDLTDFAQMVGMQSFAAYGRLVGSDAYFIDEDMATLMHPQVILAWLLNDQPIPPQHGAPLRLIVPFRYGARSIKAIQENIIPPTINLDNPDPNCDLDYVPHKPREQKIDVAMSNSFGFGGHNATVLIRRFEG